MSFMRYSRCMRTGKKRQESNFLIKWIWSIIFYGKLNPNFMKELQIQWDLDKKHKQLDSIISFLMKFKTYLQLKST